MEQKLIKEKYMDIIRTEVWPDSEQMQKFAEKEFYYGVELNNGDIYVIERPEIKKNFCFGYGLNGVVYDDEQDKAYEVAQMARENESYFIKENLAQIEEKINDLLDPRYESYKHTYYISQSSGSKLKTYSVVNMCDNPEYAPYRWQNLKDVEKLTDEEINALIDGYKAAKEMFTKRFNTYLKKYGLSKLNVWTYLRD